MVVVLAILSIFTGNISLDVHELLNFSSNTWHVILVSRLPRTLAVLLSGVGLSLSGLVMQKLAQNRFVSPSTAATQDSARLGIMISLICFSQLSVLGRSVFAFLFAMTGTALFMLMIRRTKMKNMMLVPLIGLMLGLVIEAITTFLAMKFDVLQVLSAYMTGSFSLTIQGSYELLYLLIPAVVLIFTFASAFNIAALGEDFAHNLGIHYRKIVNIGLVLISFVDAIILTTVGSLPFIGLIIPNIVTLILGDSLKQTLPLTAFIGGIFLLMVDLLARVLIAPYEVPIALIIGILGSLIFLMLIFRSTHYEQT